MNLKNDFPAFEQKIRGKNLVYLDSAASALKPKIVIDRIQKYYTSETANIHRGAHFLGDLGTQNYEKAREKIKNFISAQSSSEIVFTSGTTESINLVAHSYVEENLIAGDEIILSEMEHHANLVPWIVLAEKKSLKLKYISVTENGELDSQSFLNQLSSRTRFVALTHCSNTLGTINDVSFYIQKAHEVGAKVLIDGAQYVVQDQLDVQKLDCDFYVFSGHKLFGPYGIGVLYAKETILKSMKPYKTGGSMISQVTLNSVTYNDIPYKFEAGTPNISAGIALGTAIDYIQSLGFEKIREHEMSLLKYATSELAKIPELKIIGNASKKAAIVSFIFSDMHSSDVGQILDQEGIAVRVGHHCTQPLMQKFNITGTIRASFSIYNNHSDIDALVKALLKARELLT